MGCFEAANNTHPRPNPPLEGEGVDLRSLQERTGMSKLKSLQDVSHRRLYAFWGLLWAWCPSAGVFYACCSFANRGVGMGADHG
jgi:hypothetical protein